MSSEELLAEICRYAEDKKAADLLQLDLREVLGYTDWFVICSGNTERQTKVIPRKHRQHLRLKFNWLRLSIPAQ